jgi:hypothetical protein
MKNSMQSIGKLLILDYYVLKVLFRFIAIALAAATVIGCVTQPAMLIVVILTFSAFILSVLFSVAETSNFNKLYGTLPINKKEVIIGRYAFSLLVVSILSIIAVALYSLSSLLLKAEIEWTNGALYWGGAFIIAALFISIQYPFYFKFDYSKAMIMSILPFILLFMIGFPVLGRLMKDAGFTNAITKIITHFESHVILLILCVISIGLILLTLSCLISILLTKKKR